MSKAVNISKTTNVNSGDETAITIKTALGISTLSGSNTGDQTTISGNAGTATSIAGQTTNGILYQSGSGVTASTLASTAIGQVLTTTTLGGVPTWETPSAGGGGVAGTTGQVQYNNAGAAAGASYVNISGGNLQMVESGATPAVPVAGTIALFVRSIAGRLLPAWISPSGLESPVQAHWGRNRAIYWQPIGNATTAPLTTGIASATALGTATIRNVATTNIATRIKRHGYVSTATAASLCGHYWTAVGAQFTTGDGAGLGGFTYMERVVVSDAAAVAGARMFIGMSSNIGTATNVEPNTLTNAFGFAQLSTDNTQWYFVYGGSAAQTAIAMGTALGAPTLTNTAWDIALFADPSVAGKVGYEIKNLSSGISVEGSITGTSAQMPISTTLLAPRAWRCNNATALACGLDIASMYIETDQ